MLDHLFPESDPDAWRERVVRNFNLLCLFSSYSDVSLLHITLIMLLANLHLQIK